MNTDARGRLGREVESRINELGLDYVEVARTAGFSVETLRKIREGTVVADKTLRRLEPAIWWVTGSCQRILEDGKPTPADVRIEHEGEPTRSVTNERVLAERVLDAILEDLTDDEAAELLEEEARRRRRRSQSEDEERRTG